MKTKKPTNASKLNHELRRAIVRQLKLRRHVRTWAQIAKLHKISRRNLMGHIRKLRAL